MFAAYCDATDWLYEIPETTRQQAWQHSQHQVGNWAKWNAYLNQIAQTLCVEQLQAEGWEKLTPMDRASADRTWAFVNGSTIQFGNQRLVLIPSETIDQSELEIPQEWLDIPSWAADYYLAVYVAPDQQTLQIAGYATHQQIKQNAQYSDTSRTYHLDATHLTPDINLLKITASWYDQAQTRSAIAPISSIEPAQSTNLIQRLGNPSEQWPQLEVPFSLWAALLDNPTWLTQLANLRQGESLGNSITQLGNWLQGQFDRLWQPAEQVLVPQQIAIPVRSDATATYQAAINRVKVIDVGTGQVGLLLNLTPLSDNEARIDLQIHPIGDSIHLPGETELRLLDGTDNEVAQAKATTTETIRLQFRANHNETFKILLTCDEQTITENFTL